MPRTLWKSTHYRTARLHARRTSVHRTTRGQTPYANDDLPPTICSSQMSRRTPGRGRNKPIERPGLSEEEIEEIREAFNLFDTDGPDPPS